jgi:hypothetical protein
MLNVYESLGTLHLVVDTLEVTSTSLIPLRSPSPNPHLPPLQVILKTEHQERGMLNHYKHWICEIPVTTVRVMNYRFKIYRNLTTADAKYVALVVCFPSYPPLCLVLHDPPSLGGHGSEQDLQRLQINSLE